MITYEVENMSRVGRVMGNFFDRLTKAHKRSELPHIDAFVNSTMVMIDQLEELSGNFKDLLKYVVKKSGEQKKSEIEFAIKHPKSNVN